MTSNLEAFVTSSFLLLVQEPLVAPSSDALCY